MIGVGSTIIQTGVVEMMGVILTGETAEKVVEIEVMTGKEITIEGEMIVMAELVGVAVEITYQDIDQTGMIRIVENLTTVIDMTDFQRRGADLQD